jgi:hypothetical protein
MVVPRECEGDSDRIIIPRNIPKGSFVDVSYVVHLGDTPSKIAEYVSVTVYDLKELNPSIDLNHVKVGQLIVIYKGFVQSYIMPRSPNNALEPTATAPSASTNK